MRTQPGAEVQAARAQAVEEPAIDWPAIVADAIAAPSLHNTQPWRFVAYPDMTELYLDPQRLLVVADPNGREARLSCGAALFNLRLALRARGMSGETRLLPDRSRPRLLAVVRVVASRPGTPLEAGLHRAIHRRHSHRRPFHPTPVPAHVRKLVVAAAVSEGAELRLIDDPSPVARLAGLVRRAEHQQQNDPRFADELARWTFDGRTRRDGVPRAAGGPRPPADGLVVLRDFAPDLPRLVRDYEPDPLFGVLLSHGDTPVDHLRAGQALQRMLLTATAHGAAASLLSQPVELPAARAALQKLLATSARPQIVLRLGMASPMPSTPRRPVHDVLQIHEQQGRQP
jgi:nitroreductase